MTTPWLRLSLTAFTPPDEAWNEYVEPGPVRFQ